MQLAHSFVKGPDSIDANLCVLVHGILGAGMNLRSVARALHQQVPHWTFLLPDLRGHGQSPSFTAPHTVDSASKDLVNLEQALEVRPRLRIGHSFGGKVVLEANRLAPATTVLMDTLPGLSSGDAESRAWMSRLLDVLEQVPQPLEKRECLGQYLAALNQSAHFIGWMGTNLKRRAGEAGLWWRFDLRVIRSMIEDYWGRDMLQWLQSEGRDIHVLYGCRSERFTSAAIGELRGILGGQVKGIPEAGHWVHVDNPQGTIELLAEILVSVDQE